MVTKSELSQEVTNIFLGEWASEDTDSVPVPEALRLNSNHAKRLKNAVVLYADIDGSTAMVDQQTWRFAAEVYRAYLRCASQIIKSRGGVITAYDGDRVMAIFMGPTKNTSAVAAALEINFAVENIVRPEYAFYTNGFVLNHVIGIDSSDVYAARVGVRGDNDIVWVGKAANHAAKLCSLSTKPIWITKAVYDSMADDTKYQNHVATGVNMWEPRTWTPMNNAQIYCSSFVRTLAA